MDIERAKKLMIGERVQLSPNAAGYGHDTKAYGDVRVRLTKGKPSSMFSISYELLV